MDHNIILFHLLLDYILLGFLNYYTDLCICELVMSIHLMVLVICQFVYELPLRHRILEMPWRMVFQLRLSFFCKAGIWYSIAQIFNSIIWSFQFSAATPSIISATFCLLGVLNKSGSFNNFHPVLKSTWYWDPNTPDVRVESINPILFGRYVISLMQIRSALLFLHIRIS